MFLLLGLLEATKTGKESWVGQPKLAKQTWPPQKRQWLAWMYSNDKCEVSIGSKHLILLKNIHVSIKFILTLSKHEQVAFLVSGRERLPGLCWLRQRALKNLGLEQHKSPCRVRIPNQTSNPEIQT